MLPRRGGVSKELVHHWALRKGLKATRSPARKETKLALSFSHAHDERPIDSLKHPSWTKESRIPL